MKKINKEMHVENGNTSRIEKEKIRKEIIEAATGKITRS